MTRPYRTSTLVYFIQGELTRLIKIGRTEGAAYRLGVLQTGSPDKLNIIGVIPHDHADIHEKVLHERFYHLRERGEWHRPGPDLMDYIERHALSHAAHQNALARSAQIKRGLIAA
jgi:hypothetical protein